MAEEQEKKKPGRPKGSKDKNRRSRPDRSLAQKIVPDEKVARRINQLHTILWELPKVNLDDPEEVNERTVYFFQLCDELNVKALLETYSYAMGYSNETIRNIASGLYHREVRDIIEKAYWRLKSDLAQLSAAGQVNPVTAIFQQKNNYGYVDKVEISTTPQDPLGEQSSITEIKRRLIDSVPQDVVGDAEFTEVKPKELEAVPVKSEQ